MRLTLLALSLILPAAAMAQTDMGEVTYQCASNRTLSAAFINAGEESFAVINEGGRMVPMVIAVSASGARYLSEDDTLELWAKGAEATLTLMSAEGETVLYHDCTETAPVDQG